MPNGWLVASLFQGAPPAVATALTVLAGLAVLLGAVSGIAEPYGKRAAIGMIVAMWMLCIALSVAASWRVMAQAFTPPPAVTLPEPTPPVAPQPQHDPPGGQAQPHNPGGKHKRPRPQQQPAGRSGSVSIPGAAHPGCREGR